MVSHHIAHRACFLVIATARADTELFADGDLYVVDGLPVPELLENRVREPEHEDVLHRFLPEIMVDAENLSFTHELRELVVQRAGGNEIMTEWLFEDHPLPKRIWLFLADQADAV